ncbi:MAG: UvrD-helicase domain-containing protein [Bacteroidales bacterium]|nr:UvrD-helicase domain-containing protein [Bacteroidales bacterium]
MSQLKVIQASAGSGKTHHLTLKYLELLITENLEYFRSILAVTFTNKASDEMKRRIISELYKLASNYRSDHIVRLQETSGFTEDHVRNKAGVILKNILHEFSWFNVETIDTFFQRIIRAFTRELGIPGNYEIETETRPALEFAADNLINEIEEDSGLFHWLMQFAIDKMDTGKTWDIRYDLLRLGEEVFKEEFTSASAEIYKAVSDKKQLDHYRNNLHAIIKNVEKKIIMVGEKAVNIITENGLDDSDFFYKGKGVSAFFRKLSAGIFELPNSYVIQLLEDSEKWPSGDSQKKQLVIQLAEDKLRLYLNEAITIIEQSSVQYFSTREILKNIYALGILSDLYGKISQYRTDRNRFILSESPGFINRIIGNNEVPFIYERTGNRFHHYLIDEFQDTSYMQWNNFKPLISNSLSMGFMNLLVGDAKQSIYRWRNSNWEIIANNVIKEFPTNIKLEKLETNWRSYEKIVEFNNWLFEKAKQAIDDDLSEIIGEMTEENSEFKEMLGSVYGNLRQNVSEANRNKGHVRLKFFVPEQIVENPEYFKDDLIEDISSLLQNNYEPGEIAIIVREKKEGLQIAELLIESNANGLFTKQVGVISDESLFLETSLAVNLLIAAMRYLIFPDDDINRGKLASCYNSFISSDKKPLEIYHEEFIHGSSSEESLKSVLVSEFIENADHLNSLPLYELTERIIKIFNLENSLADLPYVHAFLDMVHDFCQTFAPDTDRFLQFWDDEGKTKSVSASESRDAIRILTVHKSKGLEFRAVIIPFCHWSLNQKSSALLWTSTTDTTFSYLPRIPVQFSNNLSKTVFSHAYYSELFKSYIDNFNLLYVAFTRAKESLIVYSKIRNYEKKKNLLTVGDLIYQTIVKSGNKNFNSEELVFKSGEIDTRKISEKKDTGSEKSIVVYKTGSALDRIFYNPMGYEYFQDSISLQSGKLKSGRVAHYILSQIETEDQLNEKLAEARFAGLISDEDAHALKYHISKLISDPEVAIWFDGSGVVLREQDIILPDGGSRRPDRIIIFKDRVDIIDYKMGSEQNAESHKRQVAEYRELLMKMGYKNVMGYLWYVADEKIVRV